MWFAPGPLSDNWEVPVGSGPKFLTKYLIAQQVKHYGSFYTGLPRSVLQRNMKLLCDKYPEDDIKRAIAYGCLASDQVFSTKFVKDILDTWLQDIRSSPLAKFYRNKS